MIAALAAGLVLLGGPATTSPVRPAEPDVTALFTRALATVHAARRPLFARAVVYEADGATAGGRPTSRAAGIVRWRFVFDNFASRSRFASATISYGPPPKRFGPVIGVRSPFLEDVPIQRAPALTLAAAVAAMRRAGYRGSFTAVTLRRPLGPHTTPPLYLFTLADGRFVAVNTATRRVTRA